MLPDVLFPGVILFSVYYPYSFYKCIIVTINFCDLRIPCISDFRVESEIKLYECRQDRSVELKLFSYNRSGITQFVFYLAKELLGDVETFFCRRYTQVWMSLSN